MKKIQMLAVLAALLLPAATATAQDFVVRLDASTHGTILDGSSYILRDDDSQGQGAPEAGSPMLGIDYYITITGGCVGAQGRLAFQVNELSVSCLDTIYVYDGYDTTGNLITKFNSFTGNVAEGDFVFVSNELVNPFNYMTIRFKTDPLTSSERTNLGCFHHNGGVGQGFELAFFCGKPCENPRPVIDTMFYRTRNGVVYDSAYLREIVSYDTTFVDPQHPELGIESIDTISFIGANLCIGDGVIFHGYGDYTYKYGYYTPSDATSWFVWSLGNQGDTVEGQGVTEVVYNDYQRVGCYDVFLSLTDEYGCSLGEYAGVKVRTAANPIKTIYTLSDICNHDSLMVNMGYDGDNATLTLGTPAPDTAISKTYEVRTFIPDGCNCASPPYFEAPVEFTEFPNNRKVNSAKDICSICINMEHSYMGDIFMSIVCPTGQESLIKYGNTSSCPFVGFSGGNNWPQNGQPHGGYKHLGHPLDEQPGTWDSYSNQCDSLYNPYGIGLDYCFSRDTHYTLVTGQNAAAVWSSANPVPTGNFYIISDGYMDNLPVTFPPVPAGFQQAGQTPVGTQSTKRPSNHEEKTDYYLPYTTFSELVGCPLNGVWKIRVQDTWGSDNGWIFNWSLDICNVSEGDCDYVVGIDSLVWAPDTAAQYHDYELGRYRGVEVHRESPTVNYILSPDTAGTFPINVFVYDGFGCVWDTSTRITSYWTPMPDLGPDTILCGVDSLILNASDRYTDSLHFTYRWEPFGQTTDTISTLRNSDATISYVVEATNTQNGSVCARRDSIRIRQHNQPLPSFIPTPFVFEGCAPFTMEFQNQSVYADRYLWDFGDGFTSTLENPSHTYEAGVYDLKFYALSDDGGCVDSLISPQAIAVYNAPKAAYAWEPIYPSVLHPVVELDNRTEPKVDNAKYFWEVQYNPDNPRSVHTVTDETPSFDFSQYVEGDPSGLYSVRLIVRTDNLAPTGNMVYCSDTTENTILVVNDFLQFPNVVTPNGDGINDVFIIRNLVEGGGYPVNSLDIYNKWGAHVYHKDNISSLSDFWDPKDMPAGTYFYRFSARGYNGNIEHNGAIEVVK